MLPVRTDPNVPKHAGLTYFIVDMKAEGVDVRPMYQITGEAEFNEVFFTDVHVPDAYRIDEVGAGWRASMTTLMNERVAIGSKTMPRGSGSIEAAIKAWKDYGHTDPGSRDELTRLWASGRRCDSPPCEPTRCEKPACLDRKGPPASWPGPISTRPSLHSPLIDGLATVR